MLYLQVFGVTIFNSLMWIVISRPQAPRWSRPALAATTMTGVAVLATATRSWVWIIAVVAPLLTTAAMKCLWAAANKRPGGRMARLLWRQLGKITLRGPDGQPMLSLVTLREEYGQNLLDDAARDPELDRVIDDYAEHLEAHLREVPSQRSATAPLNVLTLTAYANGYLRSVSDPHRPASRCSPYRSYSTDMVVLAALCRLADRLDSTVMPKIRPRPAR
jgi:hypothetical protein